MSDEITETNHAICYVEISSFIKREDRQVILEVCARAQEAKRSKNPNRTGCEGPVLDELFYVCRKYSALRWFV